jgi:putative DNA methylase
VSGTVRTRKLIEVGLPLEEINAACKAYKDRKVGTIRNLHKWFAAMPLPAWRALLFAALVDAPEDDNARIYLLDLIKRLVANGADLPDESDMHEARMALERQFPDGPPMVLDPFCGGGSTLVEAQRLGLSTLGTDLNPVPVLITRALTELLPKVQKGKPVHPPMPGDSLFDPETSHSGPFSGFIEDVRFYAQVVQDSAAADTSSLFPPSQGEEFIAWRWARTTRCPNPTCGADTFLLQSMWISKKKGDLAWFEPVTNGNNRGLRVVSGQLNGDAPDSPKVGRGANFQCLYCGNAVSEEWLIAEGKAGRIADRLVCVVTQRANKRHYRSPTEAEIRGASVDYPDDFPTVPLPDIPRWFSGPRFGFTTQRDLYGPRQIAVLDSFANAIADTFDRVQADGGSDDWAAAVATMLGLGLGKLAQANSRQVRWNTAVSGAPKAEPAFGQNDMPMLWDYVETNPFGSSVGSFQGIVTDQARALRYVVHGEGHALRRDAREATAARSALIATDPPYFDAIGYADLSDYFYLWHRRALRKVHPDLYMTVAAPKKGELTAVPAHHGGPAAAKDYFIDGFTETFNALKSAQDPNLPLLVVYASKEQKAGSGEETRWASILTAMIAADLEITGTWPIHGATVARLIGNQANSIASYIVMVCRPRPDSAGTVSLADFSRVLRRELAPAVRDLQAASILPIDLAQAAMGPGMQIYSRYRAVLDQSGSRVPVEQALRMIDTARSEVLDEQEGELDSESRFAVRWWATYGWGTGTFDAADKTARPLGIGVDDAVRAQVATSQANKVSLLGNSVVNSDWTPSNDRRPTAWEAVHHLAHRLIDRGGELEAARLMGDLGSLRESTMTLTYRLHDLAAASGRTADQERYNALINSWAELVKLSSDAGSMSERLF